MTDETTAWAEILRGLAASATIGAAAYGALGGITNALVVRVTLREAIRQVLLGAVIAAGMGSLSIAAVAGWMGWQAETIPAGGAVGSAAYLVGVFGSAVIEVMLGRIRRGRLPGEGAGDA